MTPSPPDLPDARRSRVSLWAIVPIVLGALILVGGAVFGLVFALRGAPATSSSATAARPTPPAIGTSPRGITPPPKLATPEFDSEEDAGEESAAQELAESDDPSEFSGMPRSPSGDRVWPDEVGALLPVSKGQAVWGTASAPVTLALFGDLECEHTRAELRSLGRIAARKGANLRLVFYHRPLAEHADARGASLILAATALQMGSDASWRVLSAAAASREAPNPDEVARWLSSANVGASRESLARDPLAEAQVESDRLLATKLDVRATPTLFVNGRRVIGRATDAVLESVINEEARTMRWLVAQGMPPAQAYSKRVRKNLIGVGLGVDRRDCVPLDKAPTQGASAPLVTIVEFSDFECDACRSLEPALTSIVTRHAGVVRRAWRSFALPQHRHAERAAAFALSARELGGERAFWTVHAALFGVRSVELDDEQLRGVASRLGLDADKLLSLAEHSERAAQLASDHELAENLGLDGAPTLFINGRRIAGAPPAEALEAVVREELEAARRIVKAGSSPAVVETLLCAD
ncbi:MAG: DsbA family protein [Myxococcota bacterium]